MWRSGNNEVWKLKRALYGLRESPALWFNKIKGDLLAAGYIQSSFDFCLFFSPKDGTALLVYVDDILIIGGNDEVRKTKEFILNSYKAKEIPAEPIKDGGSLYNFLGLEIKYFKGNKIEIGQSKLTDKICTEFSTKRNLKIRSPLVDGAEVLNSNFDETVVSKSNYRRVVGSLMYL
jgi:hypothetical protein